jgi:hypothetical protein
MGGANATLECHPVSGDFDYADQYTPTIDHNLTEAQGGDEQLVGIRPETQGVTPWCARMPRLLSV